jgi:hypothetical protein
VVPRAEGLGCHVDLLDRRGAHQGNQWTGAIGGTQGQMRRGGNQVRGAMFEPPGGRQCGEAAPGRIIEPRVDGVEHGLGERPRLRPASLGFPVRHCSRCRADDLSECFDGQAHGVPQQSGFPAGPRRDFHRRWLP